MNVSLLIMRLLVNITSDYTGSFSLWINISAITVWRPRLELASFTYANRYKARVCLFSLMRKRFGMSPHYLPFKSDTRKTINFAFYLVFECHINQKARNKGINGSSFILIILIKERFNYCLINWWDCVHS